MAKTIGESRKYRDSNIYDIDATFNPDDHAPQMPHCTLFDWLHLCRGHTLERGQLRDVAYQITVTTPDGQHVTAQLNNEDVSRMRGKRGEINSPGIFESKLFAMACIRLAKRADFNRPLDRQPDALTVQIPLDKFAELLRRSLVGNKRKDFYKDIRRAVDTLSTWAFTMDTAKKGTRIFAKNYKIRSGMLIITFTPECYQALTSSKVFTRYPFQLFTLKNRAYKVAKYITLHVYRSRMFTKEAVEDENRNYVIYHVNQLSIEKILLGADFPDYSNYYRGNRSSDLGDNKNAKNRAARAGRHYRRDVINPLEDILDNLVEIGLIQSWEHTHMGQNNPMSDEERDSIQDMSFPEYSALYLKLFWKLPVDITPAKKNKSRATNAIKKRPIIKSHRRKAGILTPEHQQEINNMFRIDSQKGGIISAEGGDNFRNRRGKFPHSILELIAAQRVTKPIFACMI